MKIWEIAVDTFGVTSVLLYADSFDEALKSAREINKDCNTGRVVCEKNIPYNAFVLISPSGYVYSPGFMYLIGIIQYVKKNYSYCWCVFNEVRFAKVSLVNGHILEILHEYNTDDVI